MKPTGGKSHDLHDGDTAPKSFSSRDSHAPRESYSPGDSHSRVRSFDSDDTAGDSRIPEGSQVPPVVRRSSGTRPAHCHEVDAAFVAREVGDIPMPPSLIRHHRRMRGLRRGALPAEMMRALLPSHRMSDDEARKLWWEVVAHRKVLRQRLGRRVAIAVAALDLLTGNREIEPHVIVHEEAWKGAAS